jgi:hypothetical protein
MMVAWMVVKMADHWAAYSAVRKVVRWVVKRVVRWVVLKGYQ